MFGRSRKTENGKGKMSGSNKRKKGKRSKARQEELEPIDTHVNNHDPENPEDLFIEEDLDINSMDQTEKILLNLHSNLIDFYNKHKPENLDEDILTILMQYFIDAGGVALNRKLREKYGEDLTTFKRSEEDDQEEPPPPPEDYAEAAKTMNRISKRHSVEKEYGISIPPPPKIEMKMSAATSSARNSLESTASKNVDSRARNGKKKVNDPELEKYKESKNNEIKDILAQVEAPPFIENVVDEKRLGLLDSPKTPLEPRDYIEAFYSKFDESKLDSDTGIEKFVNWVELHSMEELSEKLRAKYDEGLYEQEELARRRKNLETLLTNFYLKYDRGKLETRWTIMKILNWTMTHGVPALNKKFHTRYGHVVVEEELDI